MRGYVPCDPETGVSTYQYAVVYVPRRNRNRFAGACVSIKKTSEQALHEADPDNRYFAARVLGPSKSSEGQILYYLAEWLEDSCKKTTI